MCFFIFLFNKNKQQIDWQDEYRKLKEKEIKDKWDKILSEKQVKKEDVEYNYNPIYILLFLLALSGGIWYFSDYIKPDNIAPLTGLYEFIRNMVRRGGDDDNDDNLEDNKKYYEKFVRRGAKYDPDFVPIKTDNDDAKSDISQEMLAYSSETIKPDVQTPKASSSKVKLEDSPPTPPSPPAPLAPPAQSTSEILPIEQKPIPKTNTGKPETLLESIKKAKTLKHVDPTNQGKDGIVKGEIGLLESLKLKIRNKKFDNEIIEEEPWDDENIPESINNKNKSWDDIYENKIDKGKAKEDSPLSSPSSSKAELGVIDEKSNESIVSASKSLNDQISEKIKKKKNLM